MIKDALLKWVTHPAIIMNVSEPSPNFRLVTLHSDAFKTRAARPGDKIRLVVAGTQLRTYTPFDWNVSAGTANLLAYRRAEGVASQWLDALRVGDSCQVLGPQRSTALDALQRPAVFIGDETSFALARALQNTANRSMDIKFLFEVASATEAQTLLDAVGVKAEDLVERVEGDAHWQLLERQLIDALIGGAPRQFLFSGKSSTIQHLSRSLRRIGRPSSQFMVKAFWAPGKRALD
jgi:ferric-chelate reductase (NADPH)